MGERGLLRILGLGFGVAVVVGGVIGQGIMRAPGIVAGALPDPAWIMAVWVLGALLALIDIQASIELGAALPRAGGPWGFADRALGAFAGFAVGWIDTLALSVSCGFIAVVFGEYLQRLGLFGGVAPGLLAVATIALFALLHLGGTRLGGWSQTAASLAKALGLAGLVALIFAAAPPATAAPAASDAFTVAGLIVAMRAIIGTYNGFRTLTFFGEEVRDPGRTLARATFTGLALVSVLYLAVNAALLWALPVETIAASKLPVADAAGAAAGPLAVTLTTIVALISLGSIINLRAMQQPRLVFALARRGWLPGGLTRVAANGAPAPAILTCAALAAGLAASGSYEQLLAVYAPLLCLLNIAIAVSAIRLRQTAPDLPRPYRMPLYPLPALLSIGLNTALATAFVIDDWTSGLWSLGLLLLPLPWYLWRRRHLPETA